jgi:hypothetical protein
VSEPADVIWVEVLSRQRDVIARHRCVGPEISIGRGYANDVVLDDPYVAPRHLRIVRSPAGAWVAEDLGSAGGLFADRDTRRHAAIVLDGERPIRIGHTTLRIRDAGYPVQDERVPPRQGHHALFVAIAFAVAILGVETLSLWLSETAQPKISRYAMPILTLLLGVVGWTTVWAVVTRVFSHQARFERHLLIATSATLVISLLTESVDVFSFALSWPALSSYQYVALWCVVAAACFFHLREVGPTRLRLKAGVVLSLLAIGVAMHTVSQFDGGAGVSQQVQVRLMPPVFRLAPSHSEEVFFADVERLKGRLDRDRREAPNSGIELPFLDTGE